LRRCTFHALALSGSCAALAACAVLLLLHPKDVVRERVVFDGALGKIVGDVYLPCECEGAKSHPGVLICHGVENNKEVAAALAIEFARHGFAALAFDYGGYGESDDHDDDFETMVGDTLAAFSFLANLPDVNPAKLAMVGHSMGVSYAVAASTIAGNSVRAVVGLGNEAVAPQIPPRNLLLAMGLYDAFHTLPNMIEAVGHSTGLPGIEPGQVAGDLRDGTARSLFVSPISDHGIEPLDPLLIGQSIRWVDASIHGMELSTDPVGIRETYRAEARIVLIVSFGAMLMSILILWYLSVPAGRNFSLAVRAPLLLAALAAVLGNISSPEIALACADASFMFLVAGSFAAHLARSSMQAGSKEAVLEDSSARFAFGVAIVAAAVVSLLAGLLIHGVPTALGRAEWAKAIPRFLFHVLLLRPYEGWCMLRAYLFSSYSQGWVPEIWFGGLIAIEALRPGACTWVAGRALQTVVRAFQLRGPFRIRASKRSWAVLIVAIAGLVVILVQRLREGWLSRRAFGLMVTIGLKFLVLPLLIFILLVNLPFFRHGVGETRDLNPSSE